MGLLVRPAGRTSWTDQLNRPAEGTSWIDQLDRPAGRTSSFYLKPWPVRIFENFPFSLYIVAASESDEGLVLDLLLTDQPTNLSLDASLPKHKNIFLLSKLDNEKCKKMSDYFSSG